MGFFGRMTLAFGTIWMPLLVFVYAGDNRLSIDRGLFWTIVLGCVIYAAAGSTSKDAHLRQLERDNAALRTQLGLDPAPAPWAAAPTPLHPAPPDAPVQLPTAIVRPHE
jgi:hypothetical protein